MFCNFVSIVLCCSYLAIALKFVNYTLNYDNAQLRQLLFMNETTDVLCHIQIPDRSYPPLMVMSVMLEKTIDCDVEPSITHFVSSFVEKRTAFNLNASLNSPDIIVSPSTFKIDLAAQTLEAVSSKSMIQLNADYLISAYEPNPKKNNRSTDYVMIFSVSVNSLEMEGMYKFDLHSNVTVETKYFVLPSNKNFVENVHCVYKIVYKVIAAISMIYVIFSWETVEWQNGKRHEVLIMALIHFFRVATVVLASFYLSKYPNGIVFSRYIKRTSLKGTSVSKMYFSYCLYLLCTTYRSLYHWMRIVSENSTTPLHVLAVTMVGIIILQGWDNTNLFAMIKAIPFVYMALHSMDCYVFVYCINYRVKYPSVNILSCDIDERHSKECYRSYVLLFCCYGLYTFVVMSNVILAVMTWLEVPVHLFWIQTVIEELLQLMFAWSFWKKWNFFNELSKRIVFKELNYNDTDFVLRWIDLCVLKKSNIESPSNNDIEKSQKKSSQRFLSNYLKDEYRELLRDTSFINWMFYVMVTSFLFSDIRWMSDVGFVTEVRNLNHYIASVRKIY